MACISAVVASTFFLTLILPALANPTYPNTTQTPPYYVFDSLSPATASVIYLHGYGSPPEGVNITMAPFVTAFQSSGSAHVRFIGPYGSLLVADEESVSGPPDEIEKDARSWFTYGVNTSSPTCQLPNGGSCLDISDDDSRAAECPRCVGGGGPDIKTAADRINALISSEIARGISPDRVLLVGRSQGGALAAKILAESSVAFGGALSIVGWLPDGSAFVVPEGRAAGGGGVRFLAGAEDEAVPLSWVKAGLPVLKKVGVSAEIRVFEGLGHDLSDEVLLEEIGQFLKSKVPGGDFK